MNKLSRLTITWNDDTDINMTKVESCDTVLKEFFKVSDWKFIRHIYHAVIKEEDVVFDNKSVVFTADGVNLYVDGHLSQLGRHEYMSVFLHLFDILIVGANDDHHAIRYEPWWQEFTEVSYQLKCKTKM